MVANIAKTAINAKKIHVFGCNLTSARVLSNTLAFALKREVADTPTGVVDTRVVWQVIREEKTTRSLKLPKEEKTWQKRKRSGCA